MAEFNFASRYADGLNMLGYITGAGAPYAPGNPSLTIASYTTLLGNVDTKNNLVDSTGSTLGTARGVRQPLIKVTLIETSAQIRDEIAAMPGGKKTVAFKRVQKVVQKMRGYKIPKPKDEKSAGETPAEKKKVSQSEQSFGSIVGDAKNILSIITALAGYAPSNTDLTVANFTTLIASCETANKNVADALFANSTAIDARVLLYDGETGLSKVSQQIVDYISSTFKKSSTLYKQAVKLKI